MDIILWFKWIQNTPWQQENTFLTCSWNSPHNPGVHMNPLFRKKWCKVVFEKLSLWITDGSHWTITRVVSSCADINFFWQSFPETPYHLFYWTYFWSMSKDDIAHSITSHGISWNPLSSITKDGPWRGKIKYKIQKYQHYLTDWLNLSRNYTKLRNKQCIQKHNMSLIQFHARLPCIIAVFPRITEPMRSE